jgi:hypothetical protein
MSRHIYCLHALGEPAGPVYVGVSARPRLRLSGHISSAGREKSPKSIWLCSLARRHERPVLAVLETVADATAADEAEQFWILSLRVLGLTVLNAQRGGGSQRDVLGSSLSVGLPTDLYQEIEGERIRRSRRCGLPLKFNDAFRAVLREGLAICAAARQEQQPATGPARKGS